MFQKCVNRSKTCLEKVKTTTFYSLTFFDLLRIKCVIRFYTCEEKAKKHWIL
jgi:hypothetical protein